MILYHYLLSKLYAHYHIIMQHIQQHIFLIHYYSLFSFVSKIMSGSCPSRKIVPMHVVQVDIPIVQEPKQLSKLI